jgi:hypothetical protein
MDLYEAFERNLVDEPKEFPLSDTAYITLLPVGGDKARRAFERMMEPYSPRLNAGGKLTEEENKALNIKFYAEYVIKGWRGLKDREKKDIKYSVEAAKTLLADEKLQGFFALIIRMASNDAAFEAARAEEDEGNS